MRSQRSPTGPRLRPISTGSAGAASALVAHDLVRDEAALRKRPEQLVELLRLDVGAAVDEHVLVRVVGLVGDPAGDLAGAHPRSRCRRCRNRPVSLRGRGEQEVDEQRHGPSGRAFVRVRAPRDARDVEMRPRHAGDEPLQEVRRDARAAVARSSVREVREVAAQRLAVLLVIGMRQTGSSERSPAARSAAASVVVVAEQARVEWPSATTHAPVSVATSIRQRGLNWRA